MAQLRDGTRFALEALEGFGLLRELSRKNFDRDRSIQPRIDRAIAVSIPPAP